MLSFIVSDCMDWKGTKIALFNTEREMNVNIFDESVHCKKSVVV